MKNLLRVLGFFSTWVAFLLARKIYYKPRKLRLNKDMAHFEKNAKSYLLKLEKEIQCYEWGENEKLPLVILVHGWESRGLSLGYFVQPILDQSFRVLTFDAPGHGLTAGSSSNIFEFAASISSIIEKCNKDMIKPHIIAHSLGASATFLTLNVNRKLKVGNVILISPVVYLDRTLVQFCEYLNLSPKIQELLEQDIIHRFGKRLGKFNLDKLEMPPSTESVNIIHDKKDHIVSTEDVSAFQRALPAINLLTIESYGHYKIVRDSVAINKTIEFLKKPTTK
jgi:predicted alpha/beta hydrolase family esterase